MTIVKIFITNNFFLFLLYSIAGDLSMGTKRKNVKSLRIFRRGRSGAKSCLVTRAGIKRGSMIFRLPQKQSTNKKNLAFFNARSKNSLCQMTHLQFDNLSAENRELRTNSSAAANNFHSVAVKHFSPIAIRNFIRYQIIDRIEITDTHKGCLVEFRSVA